MMSSLPGLLGDIADIVGPEIALEVARSHGGTRIDIPPEAKAEHWLTDLVGMDAAQKICKGLATFDADGRLQGIRREVLPLGPASLLRRARRTARDALDRGLSARDAARVSGLHERTIFRMKGDDQDDGQGNLF